MLGPDSHNCSLLVTVLGSKFSCRWLWWFGLLVPVSCARMYRSRAILTSLDDSRYFQISRCFSSLAVHLTSGLHFTVFWCVGFMTEEIAIHTKLQSDKRGLHFLSIEMNMDEPWFMPWFMPWDNIVTLCDNAKRTGTASARTAKRMGRTAQWSASRCKSLWKVPWIKKALGCCQLWSSDVHFACHFN